MFHNISYDDSRTFICTASNFVNNGTVEVLHFGVYFHNIPPVSHSLSLATFWILSSKYSIRSKKFILQAANWFAQPQHYAPVSRWWQPSVNGDVIYKCTKLTCFKTCFTSYKTQSWVFPFTKIDITQSEKRLVGLQVRVVTNYTEPTAACSVTWTWLQLILSVSLTQIGDTWLHIRVIAIHNWVCYD